ncbi:MAG: hypothetical protein JST54_19675 [Deltaproteobacteria bacterium]|nr:hypothetical protein [Deltaproteobacteria bacterium]
MIALVAPLLLAVVQPLPAPNDRHAGERASQCIYYYRLQTTFVPGGSAACEADGYGLEFMRAHWAEISDLEHKKQEQMDQRLAHAREVQAAKAHAAELKDPCFAMILDGGAGPDGGQALCDLAGFNRVYVTRFAQREQRMAARAEADRSAVQRKRWVGWGAAIAVVAGVIAVVLRTRKRA